MTKFYLRLEKSLGSLKFAVIIILIFSVAMIVGTFLESYFSTEFAGRTIYKNWPFMLIQALMGLSILMAAFIRLPPKKRLSGFYVIHAGLITMACGAFVTYYAGVDGQITLWPKEPNRRVLLGEDVLTITTPGTGLQVVKELPPRAFPTNINFKHGEFLFQKYYPYADEIFDWMPSPDSSHSSGRYRLENDQFSETFTLSRHPRATRFLSSTKLGPLQIFSLPQAFAPCLEGLPSRGRFLYNTEEKKCLPTDQQEGPLFHQGATFVPERSPYPTIGHGPWRAFSTALFESSPHLLILGERAAFYQADKKHWAVSSLPVNLPWMGFKLSVLEHKTQSYPGFRIKQALPIQKDGQLIQGKLRAVTFSVRGQASTVTNKAPVALLVDGQKVMVELSRKTLELPFELILERFQMQTNPGTRQAASYESFIKVFTNDQITDHHIFMNNPLKFQGLTFYQASYQQDSQGQYASTLSVNIDQGRELKYTGGLMLVLGCMAHFWINRRRRPT